MKYREKEREKVIRIRDSVFNDPGGGIYNKSPRPFVLLNAKKNLYHKIRKDAIGYFSKNGIVWWHDESKKTITPTPPGHLLSSQISCLNHLFFLREDKQASLKLLQNIDKNFVDVCADFEKGYIGFEVVSKNSYLNEVAPGTRQTRGANCTSIDAMMTGMTGDGKKIQIVIEWKYTEYYNNTCQADGPSGKTRKDRYNHLILAKDSPINCPVSLDNLYYDPFYQIMRQTLLAWQMVKHKKDELQADDWIHLDVIPETNLDLRYKVHAPDLIQSGVEDAWRAVLKYPDKYQVITPQQLMKPFIFDGQYRGLINYLDRRYW